MSRIALVLTLWLAAAALAACGSGGSATTTYRSSLSASNGEELEHDADRSAEGVDGLSVCPLLPTRTVEKVVGVSGLRAERNDSLDLSICRYARGAVNVRILLDGAADATRRYYNQLSEAQQKFNPIPDLRPHDVRHVGDDSTYGGTGAFWTRGRAQLVAFSADRIARVTVHVPAQSDARRKAEAARLAKLIFARAPAERDGS
ncbi:hypothetical protein [Capillimicrobium parvum]|uniref:DUF3558 domain-containing protein n=1 Tax=Capillimicrobium parvum TaxID=2884022 RepID=A0A9E7BXV9_9ACTN|nr:hypothetical protein [Capillimicrobium parvum]UGS34080.1 hypothetical protein DSM104329_00451 [Capillimicrobium parvum]